MSKIQVNEIVNHFDTGAPDCPKGLTVTGFTTFSGGVSIGGTLTYEDVTNIDSVGLSTFQNGIHVTGGNVGIGTDNPDTSLRVVESHLGSNVAAQSNDIAIFERNNNGYIKVLSPSDKVGGIAFGDTDDSFIGAVRYDHNDNNLNCYVNNSERLRVGSDGNCSIGTTTNTNKLRVHQGSDSANIILATGADESSEFISLGIDSGVPTLTAGGVSSTSASLAFRTSDSGTESEKVRISSDGKVGIGSDNPDAFLVVQGNSNDSTNPSIRLKDGSDTREVSITNTSGDFVVSTHGIDNNAHGRIKIFESGIIDFATGGSGGSLASQVRINTSGGMNVGSGVISAASGAGNIVVDEGIYIGTFNGDNQIRSSSAGSGSSNLFIGNAQIQVSSDRRLKENIVDTVVDASEELKKVRVVDFTWNDPSDLSYNNKNARGTWTGVIAQELVDVFPFAVNAPRKEEDLSIDHESEKTWMLNQDQLVPVLIKGFQQALTRIETLEAEVSELRGN